MFDSYTPYCIIVLNSHFRDPLMEFYLDLDNFDMLCIDIILDI